METLMNEYGRFRRKHAHVVLSGNPNKKSIMIATDSTVVDCKLSLWYI